VLQSVVCIVMVRKGNPLRRLLIRLKSRYVPVSEAGEYCGRARQTVYRWVRDGWIPSFEDDDGVILVSLDDVDRLMRLLEGELEETGDFEGG